jgi:hypothetical protein
MVREPVHKKEIAKSLFGSAAHKMILSNFL